MEFVLAPGPVTCVSLYDTGTGYRMTVFEGESLGPPRRLDGWGHAVIRPRIQVTDLLSRLVRNGLTQHFAIVHGGVTALLRRWCSLMGVEFCEEACRMNPPVRKHDRLHPMSPKVRMLTAYKGSQPDAVPVSPELWDATAIAVNGNPFYQLMGPFAERPWWKTHLECFEYFKADAWIVPGPGLTERQGFKRMNLQFTAHYEHTIRTKEQLGFMEKNNPYKIV